jgi:hypothetical protein
VSDKRLTWRDKLVYVALVLIEVTVLAAVCTHAVKQAMAQESAIEETVACYASLMDISPRWEVSVEVLSAPEDDAYAGVVAEPDYHRATIYLDPRFFKKPPEVQRRDIVHELFHILEWELGELAEQTNERWALRLQERLATHVERWPFWLDYCQEEQHGGLHQRKEDRSSGFRRGDPQLQQRVAGAGHHP